MSETNPEFDVAMVCVLVRRDQIEEVSGPENSLYVCDTFSSDRLHEKDGLREIMTGAGWAFERAVEAGRWKP